MHRRNPLIVALCLIPVLLVGCKAAPRTLAQARDRSSSESNAWTKRGGASLPSSGGKLVLAEASVEFVTSKFETGDTRQAAFVPPHPVFLAAGAAGIGRRDVEFNDSAFERIADRIGATLRSDLAARGWTLIDPAGANTFTQFEALDAGEARPVSELNFAATDTGRMRAMRVQPTGSARVITGPTGKRESAARHALLNELGADAVVRAIIRVGVYQGRASFEEGSRILLTTPAGDTVLSAGRSLLSDTEVLTEDATNGTLPISESSYLNAVEETAPLFIKSALDALTNES